jgi:type IV pilus assembly protein PilB
LREPGESHIISIEDPVEIPLSGINQIHIDAERVSFNKALRSIMRHDPDIIMIGEIRDGETADIAVKSSLTGHLVLSTLHANNSVSVITRLLNLGIARELVASTLRLVIAQRLVRRPCAHCVSLENINNETRIEFNIPEGFRRIPHVNGCPLCGKSGYAGRLGVYEMVPVAGRERDLIMKQAAEDIIASHVFKKMKRRTLLTDGLIKALNGLTSLEEVKRVAYSGGDY